ncbi:MAG: porin family protein [Candidatus Cryptobacteroides sp.]|jgi:hypothetical protein
MKKIFAAVLTASLMLIGTSAFAQFSAGVGFMNSSLNDGKESSALNGLFAGVSYNIPLAGGLGVAPGFYYSFLTKKDSGNLGTFTYAGDRTDMYLTVPVDLNYGIQIADGFKALLFAGPAFSYGLSSKTKVSGSIGDFSAGSTRDNYGNEDYGRIDVLLGGGVGVELEDIVRFTVGYDYGMMDLDKTDAGTLHRSQLHVGVAFLF